MALRTRHRKVIVTNSHLGWVATSVSLAEEFVADSGSLHFANGVDQLRISSIDL